jgi:hypothetical protein
MPKSNGLFTALTQLGAHHRVCLRGHRVQDVVKVFAPVNVGSDKRAQRHNAFADRAGVGQRRGGERVAQTTSGERLLYSRFILSRSSLPHTSILPQSAAAGARQLNMCLHVMAITQVRQNTPGRAYYLRKRSEGKSHNEAMRCLKRRLSDLMYRRLIHDANRQKAGPGGHSGAALSSRAAG